MSGLEPVVIERRPAPGLAIVLFAGERALWASARARKRTICALTDQPVNVGDLAYRPVGNQRYRSQRILATALETVVALDPQEVNKP